MPILRPCTHPGCGGFALPQTARCAKHPYDYDRTTRVNTPSLALAAKIRNSHRWQCTRAAFRASNPICCDPFKDHLHGPEPTTEVHHVEPLIERPDLAFEWANLRPLCYPCHRKVEARERAGERTQTLFL